MKFVGERLDALKAGLRKRRRARKQGRRRRGVALLVVAVGLSIATALVYEFDGSAFIDYKAAVNARDRMRAEFHTRSGMNLGRLVLFVQSEVLDKQKINIQLGDYTGMFFGFFGGGREEVDGLADSLGGFSEDIIKRLGVSVGSFDLQVSSEDGKINLNCANGSADTKESLKAQLDTLVFFRAYDPVFQQPSADGWQRTREEQVAAIIDYVDRGNVKAGTTGGGEEYGYETLKDPYKSKNNYIDTIDEVQQIRGVDDRFWTLFGSAFTIYGGCKLNLEAVRDPKLIAGVISLAAKNPEDPVVRDPSKLWALAKRVTEARDFGMSFDDLSAFSEFVKDPGGGLGSLFSSQSGKGQNPTGDTAEMTKVEGVELDAQKLGRIAGVGPRRIYRVEVTAMVGDVQKRVTAMFDTQTANQNVRDRKLSRGAWVYWREE